MFTDLAYRILYCFRRVGLKQAAIDGSRITVTLPDDEAFFRFWDQFERDLLTSNPMIPQAIPLQQDQATGQMFFEATLAGMKYRFESAERRVCHPDFEVRRLDADLPPLGDVCGRF